MLKLNVECDLDSPGVLSVVRVRPGAAANHQQERRPNKLGDDRSPETQTSNVFLTTTHCDDV